MIGLGLSFFKKSTRKVIKIIFDFKTDFASAWFFYKPSQCRAH